MVFCSCTENKVLLKTSPELVVLEQHYTYTGGSQNIDLCMTYCKLQEGKHIQQSQTGREKKAKSKGSDSQCY